MVVLKIEHTPTVCPPTGVLWVNTMNVRDRNNPRINYNLMLFKNAALLVNITLAAKLALL